MVSTEPPFAALVREVMTVTNPTGPRTLVTRAPTNTGDCAMRSVPTGPAPARRRDHR